MRPPHPRPKNGVPAGTWRVIEERTGNPVRGTTYVYRFYTKDEAEAYNADTMNFMVRGVLRTDDTYIAGEVEAACYRYGDGTAASLSETTVGWTRYDPGTGRRV